MLLSEKLPNLHDDIIAVRGQTAVCGHVTNTNPTMVEVTLPSDAEPGLKPTIDLWLKDGWDWNLLEPVSDFLHLIGMLDNLTIHPTDAA